jgi:tRNA modification GTPase
MFHGDTIVAISSASAPAARMVIRISGPDAGKLLLSLRSNEASPPESSATATARYSTITFANLTVPAWIYRFFSPRSYTGEDLIELHIPGNPLLARMLLEALVAAGARLAEAGEFTARAWFNGKLDLTQAEGVAATIAAGNRQQLLAARKLMAGELSNRLRPTMDMLAESLALVEAGIDFSDEGLDFLPAPEITRRMDSLIHDLQSLIDESARFENLSHEPTVVLAGRPNAGKSTLTNALAGFGRSIVSDIAGTTRDALSVPVVLARGTIRLMDVAGLDESEQRSFADSLEIATQMREHALRAIEESDLLVLVHDATDSRPHLRLPREPDLTVLSKADLLSRNCYEEPSSSPSLLPSPRYSGERAKGEGLSSNDQDALHVSATTGFNLKLLKETLDQIAFGAATGSAGLALGARHLTALEDCLAALRRGREKISARASELLAADLRLALDEIGQVLGIVSPDDILGRIFTTFCIGK